MNTTNPERDTMTNSHSSGSAFRQEDIDGPLAIGTEVKFTKTIGEFDIYQFAGISGDFHANHVDEEYMKGTRFGHRIAHGVLVMSYISTCSSRVVESTGNQPMVTYGYDRVRFVNPVFIGDTITVILKIIERDDFKGRVTSNITVYNQREEVVAVARHILSTI